MSIKVVGIHHHGIRIDDNNQSFDDVRAFYADVLGMGHDTGRPEIASVPGYWINVGDGGQLHLIGGNLPSVVAVGPGKDAALPHVALAVEDIASAKAWLESKGADMWASNAVSPEFEQVFVLDPCGNIIELHQFDKCRCTSANRQGA